VLRPPFARSRTSTWTRFYASVEHATVPSCAPSRHRPADPKAAASSRRSYEARVFGVRSAIPIGKAAACADGFFCPSTWTVRRGSRQIMAILDDFSRRGAGVGGRGVRRPTGTTSLFGPAPTPWAASRAHPLGDPGNTPRPASRPTIHREGKRLI